MNAIDGEKILTERIKCKYEPGTYIPVIDLDLCEGKAVCVAVCPEDAPKLEDCKSNN